MVLCVGLNIADTSCLPGPSSTLNVPLGNGRSTAILLTVDERRLRGGNRAGGMYAGAARSTYRDLRAARNLNGTRFAAAVGTRRLARAEQNRRHIVAIKGSGLTGAIVSSASLRRRLTQK